MTQVRNMVRTGWHRVRPKIRPVARPVLWLVRPLVRRVLGRKTLGAQRTPLFLPRQTMRLEALHVDSLTQEVARLSDEVESLRALLVERLPARNHEDPPGRRAA